ncbi:MAG: hypothetical protein ACLUUO_02810 [Sellimonas intestinalis]
MGKRFRYTKFSGIMVEKGKQRESPADSEKITIVSEGGGGKESRRMRTASRAGSPKAATGFTQFGAGSQSAVLYRADR